MSEAQTHTRWQIDLPQEHEDAATDWLLEHGASATYRDADPPMQFFAYFPPGAELPGTESLSAFAGVSLISEETFADEDWLAKSREAFAPIEVGRGLFILPHWHEGPIPHGRIPIVVNPGLAFGTGGHETTRLCMCLLEGLAENGDLHGPVLDIGAGTGILAYTAHLLGAEDVAAFDIDPDCGPAMTEFLEMNLATRRPGSQIQHFIGALEDPRVDRKYNLLIANILLETIQELLPLMVQKLEPGGVLIVSGILGERQDEALLSLALNGLKPIKMTSEGEWVAILAECPVGL